MHAPDDPFRSLAALGYGDRLIPIIPPGVPISERSNLFKRIAAGEDARGKAPGVKWPDGRWSGFDWRAHLTIDADLPRWAAMGAGVGVKCDDHLVAIDADTLDETLAAIIKREVELLIGETPIRVGRYPKAIYLVRTADPYRYARVEFSGADGKRERVEILADGKQFVARGTHPATGQPYRWPRPLLPFDELPIVETLSLDTLMSKLRALLPEAGPVSREGSGADVDQASLRGDPDVVRAAVAAIPNTSAAFPSRESYLAVGYAVKAAIPDDDGLALETWRDWCERWDDGINEPDRIEGDWRRMKPPFRRGASWLYDMAKQAGGVDYAARDLASRFWEEPPPPAAPSMFPDEPREERPAIRSTPFDLAAAMAVGPRESLYGGHYIRQFLSSTIAPSKVGKSSLIICEALAMVSGKPLLGVQPVAPLRVWMWNGEDPMEELQRRIWACMKLYGLTAEDIGDRLFIDSGRKMPIVMARQTREGATINEPVEAAVIRTILENRIDVFQVDPFISSHRVSENDNNAIDVVTKRWGRCADVTRCAIEIPHHSRKLNGAEVSVEDGRGASALLATVRSSRALARMTAGEAEKLGLQDIARRLFRFTEVSSNLSIPAPDDQKWMELASVNLENGRGDDALDRTFHGDSVGVVRVLDMASISADAVKSIGGQDAETRRERALAELATGEWKVDPQTRNQWAGQPVAMAFGLDLDDPADKAKVKKLLSSWRKAGLIEEVFKRDENRMKRKFYASTKQAVVENSDFDLFG